MTGLDHYSVAEPGFLYVASRMKFASAAKSPNARTPSGSGHVGADRGAFA